MPSGTCHPRRQLRRTYPIFALALLARCATASETALPDVIPADAVVAYFVTPPGSQSPTDDVRSSLGFAALLASQAQSLGLLSNVDPATRAWIDTLTAASVVMNYPHAAALFDIKAKQTDAGGHKLAALRGALVVQTGGDHVRLEQRIQHLLNTYTNKGETTLVQTELHGSTIYTLTDKRLPDWSLLRWGSIGDYYVVAIGEGTYERVSRTLSGESKPLSAERWFAQAYSQTGASKAFFHLYARFDRIDFSADSELARKVGDVRRALNFRNVDRGLWTVGFEGRSVAARSFVRRDDENELRPLTLPSLHGVPLEKLIPPQATAYAIFNSSPSTSLRATCQVFLAARSDETKAKKRAYWLNLQKTSGVDIHRDIVSHLAQGTVIHNYPSHVLKLPLAWTFVARVVDDPGKVQEKIDAICAAWKAELAATGAMRLRKQLDGIWFLDLGIPGPAVGMRGPWIVLSYSPFAVRENLSFLAGPLVTLPDTKNVSNTEQPAETP